MTRSDQVLIERILERESDSFEVLVHRYGQDIRRQVSSIVRDDAVAEDLIQEVFLRVWTRAAQWNGKGPFRAWLFRIATNLALNHLRTVRRRRERPLEIKPTALDEDGEDRVPGWMIDTSTLGPQAVLEQSEQRTTLRRFIDELPEEKREVLRMVYDAEAEIREVAESLGVPEGTVKSRLYYARKSLARRWQDIEKEWEDM